MTQILKPQTVQEDFIQLFKGILLKIAFIKIKAFSTFLSFFADYGSQRMKPRPPVQLLVSFVISCLLFCFSTEGCNDILGTTGNYTQPEVTTLT